jgi:uncharacterized protein YecT (DUF1311 family)
MTILKYNLVLLLLVVNFTKGYSQNNATVDTLQAAYLHCLDEGSNMTACAKVFYIQMDSMLNIVYNKLQATLNEPEKTALKKDQAAWLLNRDIYFKQTALQLQKNNQHKTSIKKPGQDNTMMIYDANAGFVKQRVIVLLKKTER